jgi:hypothetical protein
MDDRHFDDLTRVLADTGWSRRRVDLRLAAAALALLAGLGGHAADAKRKKKKKKRKKAPAPATPSQTSPPPAPSCSACADNEECVGGTCVSLARICKVGDDYCTTGEEVLCGESGDLPDDRSSCFLTIGRIPICAKWNGSVCRFCNSHADCVQQGFGPRALCLTAGTECCEGEASQICSIPFDETCRSPDQDCTEDADCCSQKCAGRTCRLSSGFCNDPGKPCKHNYECCSGTCTPTATGNLCSPCSLAGGPCESIAGCCQQETTCRTGACGGKVCCVGAHQRCATNCDCCFDVGRCLSNGCDPGRVCCGVAGHPCTGDCDCCEGWNCVGQKCTAP